MGTDLTAILRRPPGAPARAPDTPTPSPNPAPEHNPSAHNQGAEDGAFSNVLVGVAQVEEPVPLLSAEAWAKINDADPLKLTTDNIDEVIRHNREHRRRLSEGTLKKGVRPRAKKDITSDKPKKSASRPRRKAADGQGAESAPGTPQAAEGVTEGGESGS